MTVLPPETPRSEPTTDANWNQVGMGAQVPQYAVAPTGTKFWGLLFLAYIPYVGLLVAIIVALVQRSSVRSSPYAIVRDNARWAANWILSYTVYFVVLIATFIAVGVLTLQPAADGVGPAAPSMLIALPGTLIFVVGMYCLVTMIRGCVVGRTQVHRPKLAIPFFRA